jgi:hypothetical protein
MYIDFVGGGTTNQLVANLGLVLIRGVLILEGSQSRSELSIRGAMCTSW